MTFHVKKINVRDIRIINNFHLKSLIERFYKGASIGVLGFFEIPLLLNALTQLIITSIYQQVSIENVISQSFIPHSK